MKGETSIGTYFSDLLVKENLLQQNLQIIRQITIKYVNSMHVLPPPLSYRFLYCSLKIASSNTFVCTKRFCSNATAVCVCGGAV